MDYTDENKPKVVRHIGSTIVIAAVVIALVPPLTFGLGYFLSTLMPHCQWAASAPAGGCFLLGVNLNWLIGIATVAFIGSFISVPIGIVLVIIGSVVTAFEDKADRAT